MTVTDTIVALATPPGRGGVAVIRVSGPLVLAIIDAVIGKQLTPRYATYAHFLDSNNDVIDQGIALYFKSPHSFTGEEVLELHGHGGPVVVDRLIARIVSLGARIANPGEFSLRAFLNDKIDLAQAEAIADLIDASSTHAAKLAIRSLQGEFSTLIHAYVDKIIYLRTYIEASIDFTDEEIDFLNDATIFNQLNELIERCDTILRHAKQGSLLREGINVVIAGKPNAGKSSLLNCLSGKARAIVTDIPGTTRDVLREPILLDDIPLHIIDTAGLRETEDVVEREGVRRARDEINNADLILYLYDARATDEFIECDQPIIYVRSKIDLLSESARVEREDHHVTISISAKDNLGIDLLKQEIKSVMGYQEHTEGEFLARRRHLDALIKTKAHLETAYSVLRDTHSLELAAEELRLAQLQMNSITGEFSSDDLLGTIFSSFCIGK